MVLMKTIIAEARISLLASALFLFITLSHSIGFAQEQQNPPARDVLGFPTLTPEFTIQCAEGDLKLFAGEERAPIAPVVWQSPQPGQIYFSVESSGCRLDFSIAYAETLSASNTVSGVVIQCTAENRSNQDVQPQIWCAWRHQDADQNGIYGTALVNNFATDIEIKKRPDPWNKKLTWWFQDHAFIRDESVLYWIGQAQGWKMSHQVQDELPPYTSLRPSHRLGWSNLSATVNPKQQLSFHLWIPYIPIPIPSLAR